MNQESTGTRQVLKVIALIFLVIVVGTGGFMIIEDWGFFDALYMTIITLSTVGFREIGPLSTAGQLWTILIIILGIGTIGYAGISQISQYIIELPFLRNRKMIRKINKMKNHYIVCGFGRMGRVITEEFRRQDQDVVVIESDPDTVDYLAEHGYIYIEGSAVDDETLHKAKIEKAKALVAVLSTDADNLFVALSARKLNPELFILTRCTERSTQDKMRAAGANKVINPYEISGYKMSQMVLSPHVDDFIEIVSRQGKLNLGIDQIRVFEDSEFVGKALKDTTIRSEYDTIITAIQRGTDQMIFNPASGEEINAGDILICIGDRDNLELLEERARGLSSG